jgi:hypothetical protein
MEVLQVKTNLNRNTSLPVFGAIDKYCLAYRPDTARSMAATSSRSAADSPT